MRYGMTKLLCSLLTLTKKLLLDSGLTILTRRYSATTTWMVVTM
ncbi:hypothetical protein F383_03527 [Gossypium arboreum]|uniref:Uncharacterized protein n=1 Tax=Gossypium arboreum TaxID=29729 RepID=A0A0B0NL35_GOSAR|nr:hypothetical protein F383_03527 [Gossypium arboreum]